MVGRCLLGYLFPDKQKLVREKLDLIKLRLESASSLLKEHIREKGHAASPWRLGFGNKGKKWAKWVTRNQEKLDSHLQWIGNHLNDLFDITDEIKPLQPEKWDTATQTFTSIDEKSYHNEAVKRRQKGTCQWILNRTEYKNWISGTGSNLLWVNAIRKNPNLLRCGSAANTGASW